MENTPTKYSFKIVFCGIERVGKSTICSQFETGDSKADYLPTSGATNIQKKVDICGTKILANIWDVSGNLRFRQLSSLYLRGVQLIVFVYDITRKESLTDINEILEVYKTCKLENCLLSVLGNKNDLTELREVTTKEAEKISKEIGAEYFGEISCMESDTQVISVMEKMLARVISRN